MTFEADSHRSSRGPRLAAVLLLAGCEFHGCNTGATLESRAKGVSSPAELVRRLGEPDRREAGHCQRREDVRRCENWIYSAADMSRLFCVVEIEELQSGPREEPTPRPGRSGASTLEVQACWTQQTGMR